MSALQAIRRPAGHRSVISACASLRRHAATHGSVSAASSPADVDTVVRRGSASSQVNPAPSAAPAVMVRAVDDGHADAVAHDGRHADAGKHGDVAEVTPGNRQEGPTRPDRGERPPFCSRAASAILWISGVIVANKFKLHAGTSFEEGNYCCSRQVGCLARWNFKFAIRSTKQFHAKDGRCSIYSTSPTEWANREVDAISWETLIPVAALGP